MEISKNLVDNDKNDFEYVYDSEEDSEEETEQNIEVNGNEKYIHPTRQLSYSVLTEKYLQKDNGSLDPDIEYKIHICMYKVILTREEPYLLYYLQKNDKKEMTWPSYSFGFKHVAAPLSPRTVKQMTGGDGYENKFDAEFEDQLYAKIRKYMNGGESIDLAKIYRGFHILAPKNPKYPPSELVVVFDASYLPIENDIFTQVSIYEILCSKKVKDFTIESTVETFFKEIHNQHDTLDFHHVFNMIEKKYVESPYCLYLCKKNEQGKWVSISESQYKDPISTLVFGKTKHPLLGNQLYLSNEPFGSFENPQRFLLFSNRKNTAFVEEGLNLADLLNDHRPHYTAYSFFEDGQQIWSVHSSSFLEAIF